jgi:hypothetical protein
MGKFLRKVAVADWFGGGTHIPGEAGVEARGFWGARRSVLGGTFLGI